MKNSTNSLLLVILTIASLLCSGMGYSQEQDLPAKLKSQLFFYRTQNAHQQVLLHTDKLLYRQGEKLWLKAYVVDDLTLDISLKSLSLNCILFDSEGNTVVEGVFPLDGGRVNGAMVLPNDIPNGEYILAAFTPEMTNRGAKSSSLKSITICRPENFDAIGKIIFKPGMKPASKERVSLELTSLYGKSVSGKKFDYSVTSGTREIVAGKGKTDASGKGEIDLITPEGSQVATLSVSLAGSNGFTIREKIPLSNEKIAVGFYPEGGSRVAGIPQLIAFTAADQLGKPVSIQGNIVDQRGEIVARAITLRDGLGVFHLKNELSQKLKLVVTSEAGLGQEIALPDCGVEGLTVSIRKSDGLTQGFLLSASPDNPDKRFTVVGVCGGDIVWASQFELEKSGVINVPLDGFKKPFAALYIFNSGGALIGERLFFTGKSGASALKVVPENSELSTNSTGQVTVSVLNGEGKPQMAELSVSVAEQMTQLGGESLLRNCVGLERPLPASASFAQSDRLLLDYGLICNRFRSLDWNRILTIDPAKPSPIYQNSKRISGKVTDGQNNPVANALINLSSLSMQQFKGRSNQNGEFEIQVPIVLDQKNLSVSATDSTGKGNYPVQVNKSFAEELSLHLKSRVWVCTWPFFEQLKDYLSVNPEWQNANPPPRGTSGRAGESAVKIYLRDATSLIDVVKSIRPFEMMNGKIVFRGANSFFHQDGALIVVDGQKLGTDASLLNNISPKEVEDIKVLVDPVEITKYTAFNTIGVIDITLRKGMAPESSGQAELPKVIQNKPFVATPIGNTKYNLITTLYWNPVIPSQGETESRFNFSTCGIKTDYVIKVTGFTDLGEWVEGEAPIRVK